MNKHESFLNECSNRIDEQAENQDLLGAKNVFVKESILSQYSYNFSWLGRPIINYPQDIVAVHELIWKVKPDLIIEAGLAHGGSPLLMD